MQDRNYHYPRAERQQLRHLAALDRLERNPHAVEQVACPVPTAPMNRKACRWKTAHGGELTAVNPEAGQYKILFLTDFE